MSTVAFEASKRVLVLDGRFHECIAIDLGSETEISVSIEGMFPSTAVITFGNEQHSPTSERDLVTSPNPVRHPSFLLINPNGRTREDQLFGIAMSHPLNEDNIGEIHLFNQGNGDAMRFI